VPPTVLSCPFYVVTPKSVKRMQYSRYLYYIYLWAGFGELIPDGLEVDHIDNDPHNDTLINFQLLTDAENSRKYAAFSGFVLVILKCPICRKTFSRERIETQKAHGFLRRICCCSLNCQNTLRSIRLDQTVRFKRQAAWINRHQVIYVANIFDDAQYAIPRCEITEFGPREMLSRDWVLTDDDGVPINLELPRYKPLSMKLKLIEGYKRQGISDYQISKILNIPDSTVRYALYESLCVRPRGVRVISER
jgi:hypothetical protein